MKNKMKQINIVDSTGKKNGSKSFTVAEEIKRLWYIYTENCGVGLLRDHEITAAAVCMCIDWGPALWRL